MASFVPAVSQVLTITPEKEYTLISVRQKPDSSPTVLKVKEYAKKVTVEKNEEEEKSWTKEITDVTGSDINGKKFKIKVSSMHVSGTGSRIWALLDWKKDS
jgi:hypothetical protein